MLYELEVRAREGYVRVTVNSDITRPIAADMAQNVTRELHRRNLFAALIDLRSSKNIDQVSNKFQFAHEDAPALELDKNHRIALLTAPEDDSHDFVELVMRNVGYNLHLFKDEEEALNWLSES